jgi:hypothetical protein
VLQQDELALPGYVVTNNAVSKIWAQPLEGGSPKQLTNFKSERSFNFALSATDHSWPCRVAR